MFVDKAKSGILCSHIDGISKEFVSKFVLKNAMKPSPSVNVIAYEVDQFLIW